MFWKPVWCGQGMVQAQLLLGKPDFKPLLSHKTLLAVFGLVSISEPYLNSQGACVNKVGSLHAVQYSLEDRQEL